jgi:sirohydrochlorin ferrochelatase
MKGLLIVAHGSRKNAANEEIIKLTRHIEIISQGEFQTVGAAFLEMASPNIGEKIEEYAGTGITEIVIFPYFLTAGKHVTNDIPDMVHEAKTAHPGMTIRITPHLGASKRLADLVLQQAKETDRQNGQSPAEQSRKKLGD